MPELRSERNTKQKKKKMRTGRVVSFVLLFLLLVLGGIVWKVYSDITTATDKIYTEVDKEEKRPEPVVVGKAGEPVSVLIMGIDTGDYGRVEKGRSDTMMVLTVNPKEEKSVLLSIPRDTRTEIVGRDTTDKINHAYAFGGPSMAINSVQNLLDIPIDYYVSVDMSGMKQLIDAVGGVTVTPPLTFTQDAYTFTEGEPVHMQGEEALAYIRNRKQDPEGDYGRQARQRQVIEASMKKVASLSSIMNYKKVLGSMEDNMKTNLSFDDMLDLFQHYRGAASTVQQEQLKGSGTMIDGVYYDIVSEAELTRVTTLLKENLRVKE